MSSVVLRNKVAATASVVEITEPENKTQAQRQAHLERLPNELLRLGTEALAQHSHPYNDIQHDLLSCLLTSQKLHSTAIPLVYRNVRFSKASTFHKFLEQLTRYPSLGRNVQSLDISELGRLQAITAQDLHRCLSLTPLLRAFLAPVDLEPDVAVLRQLLCELPQLKTLNFQGCTSAAFTDAFATLFTTRGLAISPSITELNLHGCSTLPFEIFDILLPALPRLQVLDVGNTNTPSSALLALASTVRLTQLNINCCAYLSSRHVVRFLTSHAAIQNSLVVLSANTKAMHEDAVFNEEDLSRLLGNLPRTLKKLHIKTSMMTPEHLPLLQTLTRQLDELSVGSDLRLADLESLFLALSSDSDSDEQHNNQHHQHHEYHEPRTPVPEEEASKSSLSQAVAICKLHQRLASIPPAAEFESESPPTWSIRTLDISSMSIFQQRKIVTSFLLGQHSVPLRRIEIGEEVYITCKSLKRVCGAVGWDVVWDGRRCFLNRK